MQLHMSGMEVIYFDLFKTTKYLNHNRSLATHVHQVAYEEEVAHEEDVARSDEIVCDDEIRSLVIGEVGYDEVTGPNPFDPNFELRT